MKVYKGVNEEVKLKNPVVTVGSFDGVHLGHCQILKTVKEKAIQMDGESVAITFDPHPQEVLHSGSDFFLLTSLKEKIAFIEKEGVDNLLILNFDYSLAAMPFTQFFKEILVDKVGMKTFVMGPNHSFGKNREANSEAIQALCVQENIECIIVPEYIVDGEPVRSQRIRKLVRNLENDKASKLMGH